MNGNYSSGDIVLGNWTLVRAIGEGSFGKVYEAEREDFGRVYKAAIKIITIPQSSSEITRAYAEGMDENSVTAYFRSFVEEIVQEFELMSELKGTSNVVSYEDHSVVPHENNVGWDIIIRMELLTPLLNFMREHRFTRRDVINLGIDMCKALELCQRYNIVHRDLKPENIFVSKLGDYKLGDFGIARTVEKTTGGLSKKGTYTYMAPEVYKGEPYGSSVDIYSLGIVLYTLLNENRAPFLPAYPAPITHSDRENAMAKRLSGAALPNPKNADGRLVEIVLKACAYQPKERYSSPAQMRQELEAILYDRAEAPIIYPNGDETPIKSVHQIPTAPSEQSDEKTELIQNQAQIPTEPPEQPAEKTELLQNQVMGRSPEQEKTDFMYVQAAGEPAEAERTTSIYGQAPARTPEPEEIKYVDQQSDAQAQHSSIPENSSVEEHAGSSSETRSASVQWTPPKKKNKLIPIVGIVGVLLISVMVFKGFGGGTASSNPNDDYTPAGTEEIIYRVDDSDGYLFWGDYRTMDYKPDRNLLGSDFLNSMKFELSDIYKEEISLIPYSFKAFPVYMDSIFAAGWSSEIAAQYVRELGNYTEEEFETVYQEFAARNGTDNLESFKEFLHANVMMVDYCSPSGDRRGEIALYDIVGNTLRLASIQRIDPDTYVFYISGWKEYEFEFAGRNLVLSRDGVSAELIPGQFAQDKDYVWMKGWADSADRAYQGIAGIDYSSNGICSIYFTDDTLVRLPVITLSGTNTITLSWDEVEDKEYNVISRPGEVSAEYISCGNYGLILAADGQYYRYQSTEGQYREATAGQVNG